MMIDWQEALEEAKVWAREAGRIQKENFGAHNLRMDTKSSRVDLVTEIDLRSEQYLLEAIHQRWPDHAILSEEAGHNQAESEYLWVIDPLDGTTNYAQGLPLFAVSIALQYRGETMLGVVYAPVLEQMFEARKGNKAFLNGRELAVSDKHCLHECVLATGFPYDKAENPDNNLNCVSRLVPQIRGMRRFGSAAYDLALVAAGILDGYWELNLNPWDVEAGSLMVQEAGGKVLYLPEKRGVSLVAGNERLSHIIYRELRAAEQDHAEK